MTLDAAQQRLLAELTAMLLEVTGEDERWAAKVTAASRLEGDLRLDSLELAALGERLASTYGGQADLAGYFATLDIDQIIALTVGDVVTYLSGRVAVGSTARDSG